ncbi:DEAD/DEAH box helicase [Desulfurispirillum indicum]|uniref:DEAD/DEAH box helicase n=1 Tax=Desulfurispirillum indicum TaxID=936456 RepID=UPI001CFAD10D|nr:DEAD/DEAH box helicase [Desulfurispirillum indicum]UCZ56197.1 DEAD/DEAH box helicase [Desulfurispirillum indicum]
MLFSDLGLSAPILRAVAAEGYTQPTPVQQQAIPAILQGRDIQAGAQTGTGKTAGFTLPMLEILERQEIRGRRHVRALILTPTRELAAQVEESVRTYGKHLSLKSAVIFGGVAMGPQLANLRRGVDIVVATPGRLLDHVQQKSIDLSKVEFLVLDEADRMLDMGFIHDIRKVLALLPKERQNLLFSATFSREITELASSFMKDPVQVEVARRNTAAETVDQVVHLVDRERKRELLSKLISEGKWQQVLVFTRTKHGANRLAQQLEKDGIHSAAIHGNKSQSARTKALADFKKGQVRVLVATDIAARGLDIDELPHVVNFELPNVPEDYVHRIGRTGRAGNCGKACSLVCVDEKQLLKGIEGLLKRDIPQEHIKGFEPDPSIPAEPIQNGRNNRQGQGRARSGAQPAKSARAFPSTSTGARPKSAGSRPARQGASAGKQVKFQGASRDGKPRVFDFRSQ